MENFKKALSLTLLSVSAIVCCFSPTANAVVIDFDSYVAGTIINNQYADLTVSAINNGGGPDVAVIFDTRNVTGEDSDLGGQFSKDSGPYDYDPGNVLIIHETNNCDFNAGTCDDPDDEASGGTFYFDFASLITLESIDFFDIETAENDNNAIKLFDGDGIEIMSNTFFVPATGGDNTWGQLLFGDDGVDNVKRIEINMAGSGAIDRVAFSRIPVPPAVWLFVSGFIGLVGLARRKKA